MRQMALIAAASFAGLVLLAIGIFFWRRRLRPLKMDIFQAKWKELQRLCRAKTTWTQAIVDADKLLDEALKKRVRGHNMGERMVKAQRIFTDNDGLWFAHKLRSKIEADPALKLKETEVKQALFGFRQALKDLGALPDDK